MKKLNILFFLLILFVLFNSCTSKVNNEKVYPFNEEKETVLIIQTIFDSIFPKYIKEKYFIDSLKNVTDSIFPIYTNDLLIPIASQEMIDGYRHQPNHYKSKDSLIEELIKKVDTDTSIKAKKIDFLKLQKNKPYTFYSLNDLKKNKKDYGYIEIKHLTNIVFNKDKSEACIFIWYYCGSLCCRGDYYYLKRENGNWIIKQIINDSVC